MLAAEESVMFIRLILALFGSFLVPGMAQQERAPGVKRLVFVLEVDYGRAKQCGWTGADHREVLDLAAKLVQRRFLAMERAARVEVHEQQMFINGRSSKTDLLEVSLPSIDSRDRDLFEPMLRSMGVCEFFFVAEQGSAGIDLDAEKAKLEAWRQANPDQPLAAFDALLPDQQGPHLRLQWFETWFGTSHGGVMSGAPLAVVLPDQPSDSNGAASFSRVYASSDAFGYPAIGFEVAAHRAADFARVTGAHLNQRLAIVIEGRIRSAPTLQSKLIGGGLIEGRFTDEESKELVAALKSAQGPIRVVEIR